ncbi:MAG: IS630 family transposase [Spirochaetaceae bacterium]|jgi:transposase|nr:IS630 family transposase [Spirochaetaceae bacterium]
MNSGNIDDIFVAGHGSGRPGKVEGFENAIVEELEKNNYHTRQQIADMILEKFGIKKVCFSSREVSKKNGIRRLKSGSIPAKANASAQREFYNTILRPVMLKAMADKLTLLFLDASHFVMGCDFLGYIYGKTRKFIKTFSGRKRYNVLGALIFVTIKVTTVANDTYITAAEVCEMLRKVAAEYAMKPVHIVLDNARYQKCKIVSDPAKELGIVLHYIPPYSPNLNLIERLWKHVKSRLCSKYYDRFDNFKGTIDAIIGETGKGIKALIDKLIGESVQIFDTLVPINYNTFAVTNVDKKKAGLVA